MVRLILVLLFIVVFLLISIPIILILWIIGFFAPQAKEKASLFLVSRAFRVIAFLAGVKLTVKGRENIPDGEGVLFIGNHRSYFDIVITYALTDRLTSFISKKQVGLVPVLNIWMIFLHCLFLDRDDLKQGLETINKACDLIKRGVDIVIYPEGTRNKTDEVMLPFHRGSFKIAHKTGCKIIPVTIAHSDEIYEKHKPFIKSAAVTIVYGEPIDTGAMDMKERKTVDAVVRKVIEDTYQSIF